MSINWQRIEDRFEQIDNASGGLAEFFVVAGLGSVLTAGLYCAVSVVVYGYLQLFTLATGAF